MDCSRRLADRIRRSSCAIDALSPLEANRLNAQARASRVRQRTFSNRAILAIFFKEDREA